MPNGDTSAERIMRCHWTFCFSSMTRPDRQENLLRSTLSADKLVCRQSSCSHVRLQQSIAIIQHAMSAQSSGQSPRSSTSSQPSASSSVFRKIRKRTDQGSFNVSETAHDAQEEDGKQLAGSIKGLANTDGERPEYHQQRRHRPRTSGGFLLSDSFPSQALENSFGSPVKARGVAKGKNRVDDGKHSMLKPAVDQPGVNEVKLPRDGSRDGSVREKQTNLSQNPGETKNSMSPPSSTAIEGAGQRRSLLGQDTDPAAIVNLALSLSESRRRNVSGNSTFISNDTIGGRRKISGSPQTFGGIPYGAGGGSLRQHLQEQRRISRNISPRSDGLVRRRLESSAKVHGKRQPSGSEPYDGNLEDDFAFNASQATLARAEKARVALELGYEYRRLLQYLPEIQRNKIGTDRAIGRADAYNAHNSGRAYNPLQYIRNRKVRFREKKPLNPEFDGWKDLDRVRAWVDSVKAQSEAEAFSADNSFPLPSFEAVAEQPTVIDSTDSPGETQSKNVPATPTARPTMDWIFASSDLLADIYWLHQNQNINRIEDRSWQKVVQTPISSRAGQLVKSKGSPISPDSVQSVKSTRAETSPKQTRHPNINGDLHSYERGRLPKGRHHQASSLDTGHGSRFKKSRWSKKLLGSRSSSSSGQSDSSGQSHQHRSLKMQDGFDNAALEKHMMDIINREAEESRLPRDTMNGEAKRPVTAIDVPAKVQDGNSSYQDSASTLQPKTMPQDSTSQTPQQHEVQYERRHRRLSSNDILTAPTSPMIPGLAPSIAVDLSPPESPQSRVPLSAISPTKRPLASRFGTFRRDRSPSVSKPPKFDREDLKEFATSGVRPGKDKREPEPQHFPIKDQPSVVPAGSLALTPGHELTSNVNRVQDSRHGKTSRNAISPENRRRGFFKGGRIAELVGHEVSKVGEILWRKDASNHASHLASPVISSHNSDVSEEEDNSTSFVESNTSDNLSRVTTNNSGIVMKPSKAASERQKYYMNNLPSFRSQAVESDQSSILAASVPGDDHIARQQRMMKERGRSYKFDRLAPPRIDMRSVSPSPSPLISRAQSQDPENNHSRGSSGSRSTKGTREADQRLKDMLSIPGRVGTAGNGIAPTGLAAFSSHGRGRGRPEIKRQWSISDHALPSVKGIVTKRDIARVRALLVSSGVKANEIARRNDEIPSEPSRFLQELQDVMKDPLPLIPASQEFIYAARTLVTDIEGTHHQLRDGAESFTTDTVDRLHNQIKAIDDQVNYKLTPLVRAAADDADALSTELTTTHTLAVRQLNVSIDVILRRRRRRLRWITRGGWAMLEWTVLGVMWAVWFIVVIVRIVRGTINATVGTVRWLLFL